MYQYVILLGLASVVVVAQGPYHLEVSLSGSNFFDAFTFDDSTADQRLSADWLANASYARQTSLASVLNGGLVRLQVDNSSVVADGEKRASVSITSTKAWGLGTVFVLDVDHVPIGCSVWPAFSTRSDSWPVGGGLNIFKTRNLDPTVTTTFSLDPESSNCVLDAPTLEQNMSGIVIPGLENCSSAAECAITQNGVSHGSGAGTWVAELAEPVISVWFFPSTANKPQALDHAFDRIESTAELGVPRARFAFAHDSGCELAALVAPQRVVISISLCGLFADFHDPYDAPTCPGSCYDDYVLGAGSTYAHAYFDIASLRIFTAVEASVVQDTTRWGVVSGLGVRPVIVFGGCIAGLALAVGAWVLGTVLPVKTNVRRGSRRSWLELLGT